MTPAKNPQGYRQSIYVSLYKSTKNINWGFTDGQNQRRSLFKYAREPRKNDEVQFACEYGYIYRT